MKLPLSWLYEYTDISDISPKAYADAMTMSGSKVEAIVCNGEGIENVVSGKILHCDKHKDADRLRICSVDIGKEIIQIVTGAQNVGEGDVVPIALVGAKLPGGMSIKESKLRGVPSFGMMCSHQELGIPLEAYKGACEDGVMIILDDFPLGTDIKEILGLSEYIVEFEITSNRPDCLSIVGLARESALTFGKDFTVSPPAVVGSEDAIENYLHAKVLEQDLCPRYTAKVVKNIKIEPSPLWMQRRLMACGMRPINNIVDITNYVLLEYGQPMHAFDLRHLSGGNIIVRRALEGEKITTLDKCERALSSSTLVIADEKKAVALAGIMGGENSEIGMDTKIIVFECANFDGGNVRLSAKKCGLRTESSLRFEKGLDAAATMPAILRACQLIEMLGAGEVVGGIIDIAKTPEKMPEIAFQPAKINRFLGCDITEEFMKNTLERLGFAMEKDKCIPPSFRRDIEGFADVAEEIARFFGYDRIPITLMSGTSTAGGRTWRQSVAEKAKHLLSGMGMYEIYTYSFTSPRIFDMLCLPKDSCLRDVITVTNPLGEENSIMRTTTLAAMIENLARNYSFRNMHASLFETGKIYLPLQSGELPDEKEKITLGMYGGGVDFYVLKGAVEQLCASLHISNVSFEAQSSHQTFHPGRCATLKIGGKEAGIMGEVHPQVLKNYDIDEKAYIAEIDFDLILGGIQSEIKFSPLPKFPAVSRDIAMLVDDSLPVARIEETIRKAAGGLLEEINLFDVYKGTQIPEGKKSVAYAIVLRSAEKTLNEDEVGKVMNRILENLSEKTGAQLR